MTAEGRTESAGVTWTGEQAFATLKGTTYEVPALIAGQLTAGVEQALGKGGPLSASTSSAGCRTRPTPARPTSAAWRRSSSPARPTCARVIADVNLLAGQLQTLQVPGMSGKLPQEIPADAADQVKDLTVTVYTGAEDQVLRRLVVEGVIAPDADTDGKDAGRALLDLTLTKVGEDQQIEAPENVKPFAELLSQFQSALTLHS